MTTKVDPEYQALVVAVEEAEERAKVAAWKAWGAARGEEEARANAWAEWSRLMAARAALDYKPVWPSRETPTKKSRRTRR